MKKMKWMHRRTVQTAQWACRMLLVICCVMPAFAQTSSATGLRYGVLSLIGDRVYAVTNVVPNLAAAQLPAIQKIDLVMPDGVFDEFTLKAVDGFIKRAVPDASVTLLAVNEPKLFMLQTNVIDAGGSLEQWLPSIREALANTAIDRLILITKNSAPAHPKMGKPSLAAGKFFGLGFYSDNQQRPVLSGAKRTDKATPAGAFVAPYVYIQASLVDAKTWVVLKKETVAAATTRVVALAKEGENPVSAYDAMSGQDKVATISKMLDYELSIMLPKLMAK